MYINGKFWIKSGKTYPQMIKMVTSGKWFGIVYGNLELSLKFYRLYKDKIFIDCVTKS